MRLVADTSVLIFLAKINALRFLEEHEVMIPYAVLKELEKKENEQDYLKIKKLIDIKSIEVKKTDIKEEFPASFGEGEKAVISLAVSEKADFVLIDEKKARTVSRLCNLKPRGTIGVIIDAYLRKKITKHESKELVFKLLEKGYRLEQNILVDILKFFDKN